MNKTRVYAWTPSDHCLRVRRPSHEPRILSAHDHMKSKWAPYSMAQAILTDFQGKRCAAEWLWEFADEKLARLDMARRWELAGDEISAWLGSKETLKEVITI